MKTIEQSQQKRLDNLVLNILKFYRVKDWLHVLGLSVLGYVFAVKGAVKISQAGMILLISGFYLAHGYSINDFYDKQIKGFYSRSNAIKLSVAALALCLMFCLLVSVEIFLIALFGHFCGALYSVAPFRLKNHCFLDLIFNSLALTPLFLIGYYAGEKAINLHIVLGPSIMIFSFFMPVQLMHEIQDYETDKGDNSRNTLQTFGINNAGKLIMGSVLGYLIVNLLCWKLQLLSGVFFLCNNIFVLMLGAAYINLCGFFKEKKYKQAFKIKLVVRLIAIIYGAVLFLTFLFGN